MGGDIIRKIERVEPQLLHALPRLIARLPQNHSRIEELENQLYRIKAGFLGERIVDKSLEFLTYQKSGKVHTNLHLFLTPEKSFQLDILLVTQKSIFILEVKNMGGDLYFRSEGDLHQLEQSHTSGKVTIIDCPIVQLENQRFYLQSWFSQKGFEVNVSGRVVLAGKNGKVVKAPPNAPIIYLNRLRVILEEQESGKEVYSAAEVKKINELIQRSQKSYNPFPLCEYYRIDPSTLKKGQLCTRCHSTMNAINHKRRQCTTCTNIEMNNFRQPLTDWFMLVNGSISNRECRDFLQLETRFDANYVLKAMRLDKEGKSVATRYYWPKGKSFKSEEGHE